jgi:NAD(P)H-nitrite reductase large subunit
MIYSDKSMKKQLVILGAGETVRTCLQEILRQPLDYEITVFGEEAAESLGWFEANGIHARKGNHATQIDLNSRIIIDGEGWTMPFDILLLAGARENVELARKAGIKVHRGIVVNDHLKTSDPNVFAAGAGAEFRRHCFESEERLAEQAEIFAAAMSGDSGRALAGNYRARHKVAANRESMNIP